MTGKSGIAVMCILTFTTLIAACGDGASSDGCPQSSREKPLSNLDVASCKNWNLKFGTATLVPNDVILQANMFNDVSDFKSWLVVEANLRYKGPDTGRISHAISSSAFLVGSKNLTYAVNDKTPDFTRLKDEFAPIPYDASSPYSGGAVTISMWFWVDNDDSDFLLGLFVGDKKTDKPNLWIDVSTQLETDVSSSEGVYGIPGIEPCEPRGMSDGKGGVIANETLSNCDYSNQDWSYFIKGFNLADLRGANFSGAKLEFTSFDGANLAGANFEGANLTGANLLEANLTEANLRGANLTGALLGDAILVRANLADAKLNGAIFNRNNPACVDFFGLSCHWDSDVVGANLTGAILAGADLSGADLTGANLNYADLTGSILDNATMPDGTIND